MAHAIGVIRLELNVPGEIGLKQTEYNSADFGAPVPTQDPHVCFKDKENGSSVGVWDTINPATALPEPPLVPAMEMIRPRPRTQTCLHPT